MTYLQFQSFATLKAVEPKPQMVNGCHEWSWMGGLVQTNFHLFLPLLLSESSAAPRRSKLRKQLAVVSMGRLHSLYPAAPAGFLGTPKWISKLVEMQNQHFNQWITRRFDKRYRGLQNLIRVIGIGWSPHGQILAPPLWSCESAWIPMEWQWIPRSMLASITNASGWSSAYGSRMFKIDINSIIPRYTRHRISISPYIAIFSHLEISSVWARTSV